jgi:hypothetical protein
MSGSSYPFSGFEEAVNQRHVVLLSGGYDSAYCAIMARHFPLVCAFFDYGQPYLEQEVVASAYVAETLDMPLVTCHIEKLGSVNGVFDNRNERFLEILKSFAARTVYFGCRNPLPWFDKFGDSNYFWAKRMQRKLRMRVCTPCVGKTKGSIRRALVANGLDLSRLYSTENL